ncbi:MAG: hypothetical protein LBF55_01040 [Prevotellaceae bacterium]|jgi:hypothetical protein|nr:hypothetical protein [Prevotellaceae bacterium]
MQKRCMATAALLLGCCSLLALSNASLRFRAAGVDVAAQKYYLQWSVPSVSDTAYIKGFQILTLKEEKVDGVVNVIMDTLAEVSSNVTRFVDEVSPCCTPNIYTIRLIPKDVSDYPPFQAPFRTMQLGEPTLDSCANAINLSWSPYEQLDPYNLTTPTPLPSFASEVRYHICGYAGGSTFMPDSAVWLATSGSATSFALPVAKEKQHHHLYVAAVYGSDTSYSSRASIFVPLPVRPQHITIDSVAGEGQSATLHFRIDRATEYTRFWAEKSSEISGPYAPFEEFDGKQQASITDNSLGSGYAFYRISAVNSCARAAASSPAVTNLAPAVLSEPAAGVRWNTVVWYDGSSGSTRTAHRYDVYRTSPPQLAGFIASTENTSIDEDFSQFPDSAVCSNRVCYRVEAFVDDDRQQPLARVRSPEACNFAAAQALMPNAIQLSSEVVNLATGKRRSMFEPLCSCVQGYTLYIYAPGGTLIYSGAEAWSGREKNSGSFVPEGSYVYHIKITFVNGDHTEKTGTVTVVH